MQVIIDYLGIIALLIVGYVSEKHYVSRLATFSNSIALDLFFLRKGFTPWYVFLYLFIGTVLGILGLIAYIFNEPLPKDYYDICLILYSSITTGLVMLLGAIVL